MKQMFTRFLCLAFVIALAGCSTAPQSDYSMVDLVPATGTITLDDKPLSNAVVTFDAEDGQFSYAMTDSAGHYRLNFDTVMKGVTPGKKIVRISTTRKILGLNSEEEGGSSESGEEGATPAKSAVAQELVPEKYNRQSELVAEVTLEETVYDFDLTTK